MYRFKFIYQKMIKYYWLIFFGILTTIIYAILSGISILPAKTLMDDVMARKDSVIVKYHSISEVKQAVGEVFKDVDIFTTLSNIFSSFNFNEIKKISESIDNISSHIEPLLLLRIVVISLVIAIIIKNIFFYANRFIFSKLQGLTVCDIRDYVFSRYLMQSISFFRKYSVGDTQVRILSDIDKVSDMFINSLFTSIRNLFTALTYMLIALVSNWKLFLLSFSVIPIFLLIVNYIGNKIKKYSKKIQIQSADRFTIIEEVINGIKVVKAFGREDYEVKKFEKANKYFFKYWLKSRLYSHLNAPLSEVNGVMIATVVFLLGGSFIISPNSGFSFGEFFVFLGAVFMMLQPTKALVKTFGDIKKAMASLDRINEILESPIDIKERYDAYKIKEFKESIFIKNLSFGYNKNQKVLENIDLHIAKGETVALVGNSGSGKTTLTNLLLRLYDPQEGNITIDGKNLKDLNLKCLRSIIGTVTQEAVIFTGTIASNIRYGSSNLNLDIQEVIKAAKIANAHEFIEKIPGSYDALLESKGTNLSGGQRQRLSIARAVIGNPPILIFDEATSALDTESEKKVQDAIEKVTKNRTVIVVAHRLSTILNADKIVVMDEGKIIDIGTNNDLLLRCDKYKNLYNLQFNTK